MRVLLLLIACAIVMLTGSGCGSGESSKAKVDPAAPAGDVREVTGAVTATREGARRALVVGDVVVAGELIETGGDGDVVIELRHNQVRWHLGPLQAKKPIDAAAWTAAAPTQPTGASADRTAAAGRLAEREAADTSATAVAGGGADDGKRVAQDSARDPEPTADHPVEVTDPKGAVRKPKPTGKTREKAEPETDVDDEAEVDRKVTGAGCDEVSCMLDPSGACCQRMKRDAPSKKTGASDLPEALGADAVKAAIAAIKPALLACGKEHGGTRVKLRFKVAPDGAVTTVTVEGADGALASCLVDAGQRASFPRTQQGGTFSYPLAF